MDISAIVLNKLLTERDLTIWSKLKLSFLDAAYSTVYSAISRYYEKFNAVPSFDELELTIREGASQKILATLKLIDEPDISGEVALEALIDQYTQNLTIEKLDKFVDKLPVFDTAEIKEQLSNIVLQLDEQTVTTENVLSMSDIMLFRTTEELSRDRIYLNINNGFDAALGGVARQELILIGGERGAGKSISASNIVVNQYEQGNVAAYVTIEMIARETFERKMAMLANVSYQDLKNNRLTESDLLKVIRARAAMFEDADDLVDKYLTHRDKFRFEASLIKEKHLKLDNQIIIIDDRSPTLSSLDLHIGRIKAKHGDKFTVAVIDYLNQVVLEGHSTGTKSDQFDWKLQTLISKGLKNLARKHDVCVVAPYQVDNTGEARFAKGILDAADIALKMTTHDKTEGAISFDSTKMRGGPEAKFTSGMNWETLRISPNDVTPPVKKEKIKKVGKEKTDDSKADIPWDV